MTAWVFKNRWRKISIIGLGILGVIILVVVFFLNSFLSRTLSSKFKEAVLKGTDSLYRVNFSKLDINVFNGTAVLHDITFKPDTTAYHRLQQAGKAPNRLFEIKVKRLEVSGAHPLDIWLHKKIEVALIDLKNPEIYISKNGDKQQPQKPADKRTIYQKLSASFKLIRVDDIRLGEINFTYRDKSGPKPSVHVLKEMDVHATNLLIDSATQADTSRTLYCRDIVTQLRHYTGKSANGLYTYKINSVKLSTKTSRLDIAGVDVQPLTISMYLAKSHTDRFGLHLDAITLHHFNYRSYRQGQGLDVARAVLNKGEFSIFSNPNGPLKTTDRLVTFPNWAIRQLKMGLQVDTLDIKDLDVNYSEFKKGKSRKTGTVRFSAVTGSIFNLTNKKALLQKQPLATAHLSTLFMGKGRLNLQFGFNLADDGYSYSYKGHMGAMNMADANPAVMPLGLVRITSGTVTSLDFDIHGNQRRSAGKVTFLYHNLKVDVLKTDDEKGYAKKGIISLLANTVILKSDNPDNGKTIPRVADVAFIRPKNFPFFKTIWSALLNGLKGCAGVGKADEKEKNQPLTKKEIKEKADALKKASEYKQKEDKKFKQKLSEKQKP
ncbi:AsmA family protein [Mucilaginibacter ginsenosidivorax]|uniref:DUF748 domain-containing protein n=1 Tax=Mucilaginibacter ginsenosidivorax TaxID=862126 RepID=A0A5B8W696_9SPHI|nr:hypothetical protein [Mucilaginibacter ginsenosidivorax]QEC79221.1 hypothetical protein FSB76_25935 [Mucilaginibacter ginsenosidivorax]